MSSDPQSCIPFRRARFATLLPAERRYTAAHFWLGAAPVPGAGAEAAPGSAPAPPGVWRVGFTAFATRLLGDMVEHDFEVKPGDPVRVGQVIGWIEGFKAANDLCCVVEGEFVGGNPALVDDLTLVDRDPYGAGWLYAVRGTPDPAAVDVQGYVALLNATIDELRGGGEPASGQ